jgi:hypothetical protein
LLLPTKSSIHGFVACSLSLLYIENSKLNYLFGNLNLETFERGFCCALNFCDAEKTNSTCKKHEKNLVLSINLLFYGVFRADKNMKKRLESFFACSNTDKKKKENFTEVFLNPLCTATL